MHPKAVIRSLIMKPTLNSTASRWAALLNLLAFAMVFYLAVGSAAAEKKTEKKPEKASVKEVKFSHKRGFYDQPVDLKLTTATEGAVIRFTLDGTRPTEDYGGTYSKPIALKQTSIIRAAAFKSGMTPASVETQTYIFPSDVIVQSSDGLPPAGFPYKWGENKVDFGMDPRVVNDPRYRGEIIDDLKSLPTFSLVMNVDDLFDSEKGIYARASQHGVEMERSASLELIYPSGTKGFQTDCGIRIRGGFSRMPMNPKHAFRVFFRKTYGDGKLKFPVFGENAADKFDGFDLRCSQNYSWSFGNDARAVFVRDQFNRDLQLAMGHPAARGDFCHLYINGQYWGLYDTCERPEASFAASYFGGEKEDYDVMKPRAGVAGMFSGGPPGEMPFPTDGNAEAWKRLYNAAKEGLADNARYQALLGNNPDGSRNPKQDVLLDPTNLIDYMLLIFYAGNMDAPVSKFGANGFGNNWYGIRNRKGTDGFRFVIWDAEHTLLDINEDRTGPFACGDDYPNSNPQWIWQRCTDNPEFRTLLADRIHKHFHNGGVLAPQSVAMRFEKRVNQIERAVVCESARWGDAEGGFPFGPPTPGNPSGPRPPRTRDVEWRAEVDRILKEYLPKRSEIVLMQLWNLGLYPDVEPPTFNQHGGPISRGFKVACKAPEGTIHYTTDGSDPRLVGGKVSPAAKTYNEPVELNQKATLKARVLKGDNWSPLTEAVFTLSASGR
jgi:hypothetical protein